MEASSRRVCLLLIALAILGAACASTDPKDRARLEQLLHERILDQAPPGAVRIGTKGGIAPETIDDVLYAGTAEVTYRLPGGSGRPQMQFVARKAIEDGWQLGAFRCQAKSTYFSVTQSDSFFFSGWKSFGTWSTTMNVSSGSPHYITPSSGGAAVQEPGAQILSVSIYVPPTNPVESVGPRPTWGPSESSCLFSGS